MPKAFGSLAEIGCQIADQVDLIGLGQFAAELFLNDPTIMLANSWCFRV